MEVKSKIWLEEGGELVFGEGKYLLLKEIEKTGSLNKAAANLNINYRKCWAQVKAIEDRLQVRFVEKIKGGEQGGGTVLTDKGREFIRKYEKLTAGMNEIVDKRFNKVFN